MPKQLIELIPSRVRIKRNIEYEVVWVDNFPDLKQVGECRFDNKQIVIMKGQSPTETFKTFLHEVIHAISFECEGLNLTEKQVGLLEKETYRVAKLNKILDVLLKER